MPLKPSCSSAVDWLPCRFSTSGTGDVKRYPVGMWTIAVRSIAPTVGWRVVVPGDAADPHPLLAETGTAPAVVAGVDVEEGADVVARVDEVPPPQAPSAGGTATSTARHSGSPRRPG